MLKDARDKLAEVRARYRAKVLSKSAQELIDCLRREGKPQTRIDEVQKNPSNLVPAATLTELGKNHEAAWLDRIKEIKKAERGEL
jgi:hypothetical protein